MLTNDQENNLIEIITDEYGRNLNKFKFPDRCLQLFEDKSIATHYCTFTIADLLSESQPPEPTQLEALSRLLEPLVAEDRSYVIASIRSLCHYLSTVRNNNTS